MNITLPAQALDAERAVLAAVMLDPDALLRAADILEPTDFYREGHRLIYGAMHDLYQLGEPLELLGLADRLKQKGDLERVGGEGYLAGLMEATPTAANIALHARMVRDASIRRRIKAWAFEIQRQADEGAEDLQGFFGGIERGLVGLADKVKAPKSPAIADIVDELGEAYRLGVKYTPMDFKFDRAIPGAFPGHLWMLGGYTSVGKSTLLAQLLRDLVEAGAKALLFSLEDKRTDKAIKFLSNLSGIIQRRLIQGHLEGFEDKYRRASSELKGWPMWVYQDVRDIDAIRLKTKKHVLQDGITVMALDFVQNLQGPGSLYERMSDAALKLQALALELGITVIAVSQIDNQSAREDSGIIGLKGAGELAAAADIVLWLKREGEDGLNCEIKKNRPFGETGLIKLCFAEHFTRIERRP